MYKTILNKCIESLKTEKPDISYIRGMLETLYELEQPSTSKPVVPITPYVQPIQKEIRTDEESSPTLDAYLRGNIGNLTI